MFTVLSIAGSDPSGGAGIQADLKTFADHGVYGMAAITALTAQDTRGVRGVSVVNPDLLRQQVGPLLDDIPPDAIKLGMLGSADNVTVLAELLATTDAPVVLDPVLVSSSGAALLSDTGTALLRDALLPHVRLVTPNGPEATLLLAGEAPAAWTARTGTALLWTGGHGEGDTLEDRLFLPDGRTRTWRHPRIATRNSHGTGCTLSSAIAARLARGEALEAAVDGAIAYVAYLLGSSRGHHLGHGTGPLLHGPGRWS